MKTLTEVASDTEVMLRHGFGLPEFAMYPPLSDRKVASVMRDIFRAKLDVAAEFGFSFLLSGLDYHASPDRGAKLG